MSRSNMFANLENQFEFCDTEEITEKTLQGFTELIEGLGEQCDNETVFMMLTMAAKFGIASQTGKLNDKEKALVDLIFDNIWGGDIEVIYDMIAAEIAEKDYDFVETLTKMGNNVALPFLHIILGFAYIDEKVNDDVLERLDGMFGMNLLALFMQSGLEEVPAPKIKLTGLEAEIYMWYKSEAEVKEACDNLCVKGILFGMDLAIGFRYRLA